MNDITKLDEVSIVSFDKHEGRPDNLIANTVIKIEGMKLLYKIWRAKNFDLFAYTPSDMINGERKPAFQFDNEEINSELSKKVIKLVKEGGYL